MIFRSRHSEVFCEKGVLKNFAKFTGKPLCHSLFLIKLHVWGLRSASLLKKRNLHRRFPLNFAEFWRTPFLQNTSGGCFWILQPIRSFAQDHLMSFLSNIEKSRCWITFKKKVPTGILKINCSENWQESMCG